MNRSSRIPGILCLVALVAALATTGEVLANCQNEGPFPITQCATRAGTPSWFAPKPQDAGDISAAWWLLGAGNRPVIDPTLGVNTTPIDGDGFIDTPVPGIFIGNDSALLSVGPFTGDPNSGLDLLDAEVYAGTPLAVGGLCFAAQANWALPFVDGCSDQNRTYSVLGAGVNASDSYINPYFSAATGGPGILTDYGLVDSPMAVLLTESTNKYFAVAFFSSAFRDADPNDIFDKGYDMGELVNGDENPAAPSGNDNIVPWQPISQPFISAMIDPAPPNDRILSFEWDTIRIIHDNSSRINTGATFDGAAGGRWVLGKDFNNNNLAGVGILQQPELVSYIVERKPIVGMDCDANAPWVAAGPGIVQPTGQPGGQILNTSVTVPQNTCVRLTTHFGRIPSELFVAAPADNPTRNTNRFKAQAGNLGDIGFEVSSTVVKVGGNLLSDRPVLRSAVMNQRNLIVKFETLGEIELQDFDVLARDRRGNASVVATIACIECSSGIGAEYVVEVPRKALGTATSIFVVAHPSETESNELQIQRATSRPQSPGRGATGAAARR